MSLDFRSAGALTISMVLALSARPAHANLTALTESFSLDAGAQALPLNLELPENALKVDSKDDRSVYLAQTVGDYGPEARDWEFILTGTGASDQDLDNTVLGVAASLGYFFTSHFEISIRQSLNFLGSDDEDNFSGSTRGALDYHFDLGHWWPFVGGSLGGVYGDGVNESFTGGVEGGVKWYVKPETFIFGMVEYLWFFDEGDEIEDQFDDGQFVYTLGVGFNF